MKLTDVQNEVRRFTRLQKILTSIIIVAVLFGAITFFTGGNALSKFGYNAFAMIKYSLVDHPVELINNWKNDFDELKIVQAENDELKTIISSQKMYKAELDEKNRIIDELKALYDFEIDANYDKLMADIVYRDISTWSNIITLNRGSSDGVKKDMAVISSKGLIGKVYEVNSNTCKVKLLTTENGDASVSIKVQLEEGTSDGILEDYDIKNGTYKVQLFDANADVKKGMNIITSGLGGVFPPGILVGKVESVEKLYDAKGKIVTVKPSVNFNDFEYTAILKVR